MNLIAIHINKGNVTTNALIAILTTLNLAATAKFHNSIVLVTMTLIDLLAYECHTIKPLLGGILNYYHDRAYRLPGHCFN